MAVVTPLNNFLGPEGDTVTVDEQLLNTEYCEKLSFHILLSSRNLCCRGRPHRLPQPEVRRHCHHRHRRQRPPLRRPRGAPAAGVKLRRETAFKAFDI